MPDTPVKWHNSRMSNKTRVQALIAAALMFASGAPAADNQLTAQEKAAGWKLLFDGRTYTGWEDPTKKSPPGDSFTIEDGCLKATSHPKINEDLFTQETFTDFELQFDWKISPRGNSGVKYRIQDRVWLLDEKPPKFEDQVNAALKNRRTDRIAKNQEYVIGFEYQMTDNAANPDATRNGGLHQTAALYDMFAPSKDATRPVGEFNHSRLVVKGDHVEHWLNGEKVVDASLKAPEIAQASEKRWGRESPVYHMLVDQPRKSCQISLQNHNDVAWFKNIRIKKL
jgi:3-keto-disaccharide hydrolase